MRGVWLGSDAELVFGVRLGSLNLALALALPALLIVPEPVVLLQHLFLSLNHLLPIPLRLLIPSPLIRGMRMRMFLCLLAQHQLNMLRQCLEFKSRISIWSSMQCSSKQRQPRWTFTKIVQIVEIALLDLPLHVDIPTHHLPLPPTMESHTEEIIFLDPLSYESPDSSFDLLKIVGLLQVFLL